MGLCVFLATAVPIHHTDTALGVAPRRRRRRRRHLVFVDGCGDRSAVTSSRHVTPMRDALTETETDGERASFTAGASPSRSCWPLD